MPLFSILFGETLNNLGSNPLGLFESIKVLCLQFVYVGLGMFAAGALMICCWSYSGRRIANYIKEEYFSIIMRQEQGWFDQQEVFEFSTRVQNQTKIIENGIGEKVGNALMSFGMFVASFVVGFTTSWKLSLVLCSMLPIIIMSGFYMTKELQEGSKKNRQAFEKAGGIAQEILEKIKTVTSFSNYSYEINRFDKNLEESLRAGISNGFKSGVGLGIIFWAIFAAYALAIWYGSVLIYNKEENKNTGRPFQAGDVLTVLFTIIFGSFSLGQASPNIKAISEACNAAHDFFKLKEREPRIDLSRSKEKPDKDSFLGNIVFKGVTFKYPSKLDKIILNNLSLEIPAGNKTAIVGESGSGKSTIISLVERFYDPTQGEILIDNNDIKNLDLTYFRNLIGYVPQEPVLFNSTIRENIIFGRQNVSEEEILEACKKANAHEFIMQIDKGYDYIVGLKGSKLSGGQKQRIAIARAILKKPKILILDEATSALDNNSEREVKKALDTVAQGITTIVIAHRLSTIINADNIVVLKEGRIVESGTHKQLLDKKGYYSILVHHQMKTQDEANAIEIDSKETEKMKDEEEKEKLINKMETNIENKNVNKNLLDSVKKDVDEVKEKLLRESQKKKELEKYFESTKKKLLPLIMENKGTVIGAAFFAACSGAIWPAYGILLADSIDALSQPIGPKMKKDGEMISIYFVILACCAGFAYLFQNYLFSAIGELLTKKLRKLIFEKYLRMHLGYYDNPENTPGAFTTKLASDTTKINGIALSMVGISVQTICTLILGVTLGFVYDWRLALINLGFMPIIVITAALEWKLQQGFAESDEYTEIQAGSVLSESVCNTKTIFSYNMQSKVVDMYNTILKAKEGSILKKAFMNGVLFGLSQLSMFATYAAVFYAGAAFMNNGSLNLGNMLRSIFSILFASFGLGQAQQYVGDMSKAKEALVNIYRTLDEPSTIDPFDEKNLTLEKPEVIQGKIEFKNVSFSYPSRPKELIFENLNFTILPGQKAAFVGLSGSGKSTIIQLLSRFYDVTGGSILIDNKDIREYDIISLRKLIGLVMQEPVLFASNFRSNVKYGKLNANDDEVDFSSGKAKITKFLEPMAFKNSITVSGGEKQRIAIARIFLKNPKILLLDEATSALDEQNEKLVQKALDHIMDGRTSITVAHRISTIVNSDIIFLMEKGRILEYGTHEDLLNIKARYYNLVQSANKSQSLQKSDLSLPLEGKTFKEIYDNIPVSQRYAELKNKKTDEIEFAERELFNIKKKEKRKEQGRVKIWEQPLKDEGESDINIRNKITELKKKCKENHGFFEVDLQSQKFLNKLDLVSILDSKKILADRAKQKNNNKVESIFNFVTDNREISMKNFLLDLLKDERSLINSKEFLVSKTLKDSEVKLEKDYKNFVDFVEEEKRNQKLNEQKLIEYFNHNRELATVKKKLIQENKTIVDDLDRTVKSINNLKSNAAFVHLVLGDKTNRFKVDTKIFDTKNSDFFEANIKDKDLEKTVDNLIEEFSVIDLDKKDEFSQLLNDYSTMTMKFQEFEENILKLMENKQTIEKELERMQIENQLEINKLRETEETMKLELQKLQFEKDKDEKHLKELKRNANSNVMNGDIIRMINELYMATLYYDEPESTAIKKIKSKKETEHIIEIMDCLRKSEFLVIDYIDKLDKVSKIEEGKFKSIVHSRKEDNKKKKQQVQKIKSEEVANLKKEKAEERMHRIIIKGKKIMKPMLVGKSSDKMLINENINKGNDEYNMLYYDQTEP